MPFSRFIEKCYIILDEPPASDSGAPRELPSTPPETQRSICRIVRCYLPLVIRPNGPRTAHYGNHSAFHRITIRPIAAIWVDSVRSGDVIVSKSSDAVPRTAPHRKIRRPRLIHIAPSKPTIRVGFERCTREVPRIKDLLPTPCILHRSEVHVTCMLRCVHPIGFGVEIRVSGSDRTPSGHKQGRESGRNDGVWWDSCRPDWAR